MWSPVLCKTEVSSVVCASAREHCIGFTRISLAVHVMGHDPLGWFGNCRERSSSFSYDHADRDLGSPNCACECTVLHDDGFLLPLRVHKHPHGRKGAVRGGVSSAGTNHFLDPVLVV